MKLSNKVTSVSVLAAVVIGWGAFAFSSPQDVQTDLKPAMQRKLDASKDLLEGLATEDFEKIGQSAQALSLLSLESGWNVLTTEEYLKQSADFRRILERIRAAAKEENVDRAGLGYVNLTISCIECHKYMRGQQNGGER